MNHDLKCHPRYFRRIASREKTSEVRRNDRDFQAGDSLVLHEWDPLPVPDDSMGRGRAAGFTGRQLLVIVTHVLHSDPAIDLDLGPLVVMSIRFDGDVPPEWFA